MPQSEYVHPALANGREHLKLILLGNTITTAETMKCLAEYEAQLEIIGTSMNVFFQASTCYRKCNQGPHILEALVGRSYNLCCSAYILILGGFYDEALNLVRSLGEITNLLFLTSGEGTELVDWLQASKGDRIKDWGPAAVRKKLKQVGKIVVASDDWYAEFCEKFTHVTPNTRPNDHDKSRSGMVGGVFQRDGLSKSLEELATISGCLALLIAHGFHFKDLWDALSQKIEAWGKEKPE